MSDRTHSELDARLDDAFRALPDTDDVRDLRDELRAGLVARVDELQASGAGPTAAAVTAIAELGDIEALAAEVIGVASSTSTDTDRAAAGKNGGTSTGGSDGADADAPGSARGSRADAASRAFRAAELVRRHRVRPKPAYVVRTVVFSLVAAAGLALTVLAAFGILGWPLWASVTVAIVLLAAPIGVIVGDGTHQETTANFPVPGGRAASYAAAAFLGLAGLALGALFVGAPGQVWLVAVGAPLVVISIAWFSYLGATQTNRKKPWATSLQSEYHGTDRFSQDEAAAARFGIYTVVIWLVAIAAFVVLSFTVGFVWSWLALLAGIVVFFLVLARMLFPTDSHTTTSGSSHDVSRGSRNANGAHHE